MSTNGKYHGIAGLEGREPVGAVVTIGVKDRQRGHPIEKDRFHIVNPNEENGFRQRHPAFKSFNDAAPEHRKMIRGNLVHAQKELCFEHHLKAQVLKTAHPNRMPCCVGDGEKATRWMGGASDNFKQIECPHDKCEFRLTKPPLCKPFMRFLFRIRWNKDSLPTPLMKYTSGSWNTTRNFKGFFEHIENAAQNLGLNDYTLFGFPFIMTLGDKTKPSDKSRFPVVTISPEIDVIEFFGQQREKIRQLSVSVPVALIEAPESTDEVIFEDFKNVSIPSNIEPQANGAGDTKTETDQRKTKKSKPQPQEKPAQNKQQSAAPTIDDVISIYRKLEAKKQGAKFTSACGKMKLSAGDVLTKRAALDEKQIGSLIDLINAE